jgi:hypothetical protein
MSENIPQIPAMLKKGRDCFLWITAKCPNCGRQHTHGGGPLDSDPDRHLGHRVAHCVRNRDRVPYGYTLVKA